MPRHLAGTGLGLLVAVAAVAILWEALAWPPPGMLIAHGLPPAGGATGRSQVIEGVEFIELRPGYFRMGSHFLCRKGDLLGRISLLVGASWGERPRHSSGECPVRYVEIPEPLWMARTEVTNSQFERFRASHPRSGGSAEDDGPVTSVTWREAREYCEWLSRRGDLSVRLPTEAEWEFACRAGTSTEFSFGESVRGGSAFAWTRENSGKRAHRVGTRQPNPWGLCDMHGNVFEWCEDAYGGYDRSTPADFELLESRAGMSRVTRGGDSRSPALPFARSAARMFGDEGTREPDVGFRPVGDRRTQ